MKLDDIRKIVSDCVNDVIFEYNGKKSGITSEVHDSIPVFQVWHGSEVKEYDSIDDVMNDKFYSGKSISDLIGIVTFSFV